ncbi:MAG: flagellar basal body-associated FliL family protein, partial [Candidatus Deferrimicrobiaceae bacterium]
FALEPFILNLADIESNRYLKISVTLEFDTPRTTQDAEQRVPQIRDGMILLMTSLTYGDIHSVAGKITLQSEIQNRISKIVEPGTVKRVYFTDLVVQ